MLFARSRRSKISRRYDFTPIKKTEVKSDPGGNFFPSTGETQIYRPQPKLSAATQKELPKPRTVRHTKFYPLKLNLNYISKTFTSRTHFLIINPMINLYRLIKPQ